MFDIDGILKALQTNPNMRSQATTGALSGAAGLAAGMLMGKSGGKLLGKATKYGAIAALGGLAYHAWQRSRANTTVSSTAPQTAAGDALEAPADYQPVTDQKAFVSPPEDEAAHDRLAQSLLRAMISAAKADGKIDAAENQRIFARLESMDLDPQCKAFVFDELSAPLNLDAVVAGADTTEHAAEIYAASLVAMEADTPAEKAYLQMLAARLGLEQPLVDEIHRAAAAEPAG